MKSLQHGHFKLLVLLKSKFIKYFKINVCFVTPNVLFYVTININSNQGKKD